MIQFSTLIIEEIVANENWHAKCRENDRMKSEPCNIIPCNRERTCKLNTDDFDWSFAALGHTEDRDQKWSLKEYVEMGIVYNFFKDHNRRTAAYTMSGHFPEGTIIANARCLQVYKFSCVF